MCLPQGRLREGSEKAQLGEASSEELSSEQRRTMHRQDNAQTGIFLHSVGEVAREQEKPMGKTAAALQCTGTRGHIVPLEQIKFKTCQPQRCPGQFSSSALTGNKFEALRCHFCTSCFELFPSFTCSFPEDAHFSAKHVVVHIPELWSTQLTKGKGIWFPVLLTPQMGHRAGWSWPPSPRNDIALGQAIP